MPAPIFLLRPIFYCALVQRNTRGSTDYNVPYVESLGFSPGIVITGIWTDGRTSAAGRGRGRYGAKSDHACAIGSL